MKLRYKILSVILVFFIIAMSSLALVLSYNSECESAPTADGKTELMKAVVYRCYGSPDVLELKNIEKPVPQADEVLVKVHAGAVNPLDWHFMRGTPYFMRLFSGLGAPKYPRLGVDFAGRVEAVGGNVKRFKPGDEVFGGGRGAFAEYININENGPLVLKPANISFEHAASIPIVGVTALQALRDKGKIKAGQKILINGASGGIGTFAVQIAKIYGAEVTGVCSTGNLDMVRSIGADHIIDYTREDYTKMGQRYDLIIDNVGNHSVLANRHVLNPDGNLVIVGGPKGNWIGPMKGVIEALILSPFVEQEVGFIDAEFRTDDLAMLAGFIEEGKLTPVIDRRYRLSEVPEAIRYSEKGHARGKIIININ